MIGTQCFYNLQSKFEFFSFSRSSFSLEFGHIGMESKFAELRRVTIGFDLLFGLAVNMSRLLWINLVSLCSQQMKISPC